jgi:hypothetical protein
MAIDGLTPGVTSVISSGYCGFLARLDAPLAPSVNGREPGSPVDQRRRSGQSKDLPRLTTKHEPFSRAPIRTTTGAMGHANSPVRAATDMPRTAAAVKSGRNPELDSTKAWRTSDRVLTLRDGAGARPGLSLMSSKASAQNTVVVEGVSIPRYAPQESMAKHYSKEDLLRLGINSSNTRIYVIDDFVNRTVRVGMGPTAVQTTHGDITAGIASTELHGLGEVVRLNFGKLAEPGDKSRNPRISKTAITNHINKIISLEARRQNKTPAKVDLSNITISLSGTELANIPAMAAAVNAFTARGGHFYIAAGNQKFNPSAPTLKNSTIVDGSNNFVGGVVPKNQVPWANYENGSADANGKDTRSNRTIDPSSTSIVAPAKLITRVVNGSIEYRDAYTPSGWSKLVDASRTSANPTQNIAPSELEGLVPGNRITPEKARGFIDWSKKAHAEAYDAGQLENRDGSLSDTGMANLDRKISKEMIRLFGKNSVMTLADYLAMKNLTSDKVEYQQILGGIPAGLTSKNIFISVSTADSDVTDFADGKVPYLVVDQKGKLKGLQPSTNMTEGTSWSTPKAAAAHAIWQREQVMSAKARQRL